jgi:DNA modification methylase
MFATSDISDDAAYGFRGRVTDRIIQKPVNELRVSKHQARIHDEEQIALITGSFERFGFINPIIIDEDGEILAGAARSEAARRLNIERVPTVLVSHLTADEKRAYRLADNRIAELAGWDKEALAIEFEHLLEIEYDINVLGFATPEIDLVLAADDAAEAEEAAEEEIPVNGGVAITRLGDLFRLGRHVILCGDALSPASYERIMQGELARMALSDPPYNCKVDGFVGGLGKVKHREFAMAVGEMSDDEFTGFLGKYLQNASPHLVNGGLLYTFMDWRQQLPLLSAAKSLGLAQINLAVWNKLTGGMGSFYRSQHELCAIHKYGDAPHLNLVELGRNGRYRTNVWDHQGMAGFSRDRDELLRSHPTVKPWPLLAEAIKDCSHHGDIVLDGFLGSGSTLIAAEKTGRSCRGIELDPVYCDTIIARWEKLTGGSAIHVESGLSFAELTLQRYAEKGLADELPSQSTYEGEAETSPAIASIRHRARPVRSTAAQSELMEAGHA